MAGRGPALLSLSHVRMCSHKKKKEKKNQQQINPNQKLGGGRKATYILIMSRAVREQVPHVLQEEQRKLFG